MLAVEAAMKAPNSLCSLALATWHSSLIAVMPSSAYNFMDETL